MRQKKVRLFSMVVLALFGVIVVISIGFLYRHSFFAAPPFEAVAGIGGEQLTGPAAEGLVYVDLNRDESIAAFPQDGDIIFGNMELQSAEWIRMGGTGPGNLPNRCMSGADTSASAVQVVILHVSCGHPEPSFGGMYKQFSGAQFAGRKIRFSAELRSTGLKTTNGVEGAGSLWFRIGLPDADPIVNNGLEIGITGTTEWENRHIEMEVPEGRVGTIMIGYWAQGVGQLAVRNLNLTYAN